MHASLSAGEVVRGQHLIGINNMGWQFVRVAPGDNVVQELSIKQSAADYTPGVKCLCSTKLMTPVRMNTEEVEHPLHFVFLFQAGDKT